MFHRWRKLGKNRLHFLIVFSRKVEEVEDLFLSKNWMMLRQSLPARDSWELRFERNECLKGELCNPHNSYKEKVLHNAHKLKVLHKCTQRRITGMRSRGRRGIKIPHSSDFLTRLTPRPPHHPTPGIKYYTIHKRLKYCTNAHSDLPRDLPHHPTLGRVHLVPMHERHLYLGIHIVAILGKYYAGRTLYFPEYYETRNITLLYLFCTRLFPM